MSKIKKTALHILTVVSLLSCQTNNKISDKSKLTNLEKFLDEKQTGQYSRVYFFNPNCEHSVLLEPCNNSYDVFVGQKQIGHLNEGEFFGTLLTSGTILVRIKWQRLTWQTDHFQEYELKLEAGKKYYFGKVPDGAPPTLIKNCTFNNKELAAAIAVTVLSGGAAGPNGCEEVGNFAFYSDSYGASEIGKLSVSSENFEKIAE